MRTRVVPMKVKEPIIRLKNERKTVRDIAQTLGLPKSTVWNIIKKKESTGELSNRKGPGRPRKTSTVDDRRILTIMKKNPQTPCPTDQKHSSGGRRGRVSDYCPQKTS
uniref:Transposase IS30-like HTH domain-containing protein n=1 Tax=Anguilla anguilla TaxID=7936 RepID=A0A0E9WKU5_ANGAN